MTSAMLIPISQIVTQYTGLMSI